MAGFDDLDAELQNWRKAGEVPTFWWRDDDAVAGTKNLQRLLNIATRFQVPLHLAVIPALMRPDLIAVTAGHLQVRILQHGYAHVDHAPAGKGSWELGNHRPQDSVLGELSQGFAGLKQAFGDQFLPVLVPPWTRIDAALIPALPEAGYRALSGEGPCGSSIHQNGLFILNAHCDPIKWKGGPRFTGTERALDEIVDHLTARRTERTARHEPTGLCTHHLDHDEGVWQFTEALLARLTPDAPCRWIGLEAMLDRQNPGARQ